jgi:hypothetical protein
MKPILHMTVSIILVKSERLAAKAKGVVSHFWRTELLVSAIKINKSEKENDFATSIQGFRGQKNG